MQGMRSRLTGPDALTVARIPLAFALVAMAPHRGVALALFTAGCATDVADGWWARRSGTASERGARLDSVADTVFFAAAAFVVLTTVELPLVPALAAGAGIVAATRAANLAVTRRRFRRWSVMHTDLNRASGAALAVVAAIGLTQGQLSLPVLLAVIVIAQLAATEELTIVSTSPSYHPDNRGLLRATIARAIR
ncbi:CDP-alcohol phosphatidyltransferase family protein [Demequina sp.]|uniref:CDP-alcohol phosphatidyltransferase family protein n=1 Tax=Demequina sp. TaxID=2050685 RepID=UPI0025C12130|nr:CDP-alcohol phosphatidyltransferase family protein [Demequina sp.]